MAAVADHAENSQRAARGRKWTASSGIRFIKGTYEPKNVQAIQKTARADDVAYDVGAHVGLFQLPSGPRHETGTFRAQVYSIKRGPLRRFWQRFRVLPPVEMHYINQKRSQKYLLSG